MPAVTRFVLKVQQNGWDSFESLSTLFAAVAKRVAEKEGDPRLAIVVLTHSSFERWMGRGGGAKGVPRHEPALVLSHMFNMSVERLFERSTQRLSGQRRQAI